MGLIPTTCNPCLPQVEPLQGPKEGGTRVTLWGENLGLQPYEVAVRVAGVYCNPLPGLYVPAERCGGCGSRSSGTVGL